jgi:hypothetical protein
MKKCVVTAVVFLLTACAHVRPAVDDQLFDAIDADKDGILTMEELEGQELVIETHEDGTRQVHRADADDDPATTSTMTFEQKRKLLEDFDRNRDGSISRQEWNRAAPEGLILWRF